MVMPGSSKRKLFGASKEQKENEPADEKLRKDSPSRPEGLGNLSNIGGQKKNFAGSGGYGSGGKAVGLKAEDVAVTHTPSRPVMPMSERQQIALLMQISSPSPPDKVELSRASSPRTPTTPSISRGVNKRNERGETPLLVAAIKGDTERISQLIAQGADVNATDYAGWSALHEACNRGFYGVSKLLIKAGADVNAKGLDNDTPLHDACINNHFKLVRLLLRCGAGVDVVNRRGKTPRDVCRSPGIIALIETAASGNLQDLASSSGDELPQLQKGGSCSTMSRRTPPANKSSEEKPGGGPGSPRVTLRLPNTVTRTPEKPRIQDSKITMENSEDVYEFNCKDESRVESEDDKGANPARPEGAPSEEKTDKRTREPETEEDEEARKKRRLEAKEVPKGVGRGGGRPPGTIEKPVKPAGRGNTINNNIAGAAKPSSSTGGTVTSGGNNGGGGAGGGGGAVSSGSSGSSSGGGSGGAAGGGGGGGNVVTSSERKSSPMGSAANSPKPPSTKGGESSEDEDIKGESSSGPGPKVPPLKIVLGGGNEQEASARNGKSVTSRQLPYVVNTSSGEEKEGVTDSKEAIPTVKVNPDMEDQGNSNSSSGSEKGSGSRITRSQRGGNSSSNEESSTDPTVSSTTIKTEIKVEEPTVSFISPDDAVHPRKRKIKMKEPETEHQPMVSLVDQPISNCYETFLKIRKQIERRRENLRPVQPKPPQGFKDYLMNRCSYVLAGNATSRLSVPIISPPASLSQILKDLFNDQEKERYRLRLQHLIEKEKLVLSVEQEILRVHGRAARALANQALPFSVCTFLKDEEVYNITAPEQEKDGNARSRYNGRLFLSWLQDVDDKWDKIKESMVLRHHNEAESLHAVQRMDWEWKLKEVGECDSNARPHIEDLHVPMVLVSDDFDLLPA